ncbi:LytR C-terminal domain-containing protein [Pseudonocardia sp. CA-107938]|uniref:LytR C-terminal domain-containing protein n=1 Tax=Pseudonocardia sp. CA-107938 TaxID=3240021 RepID=UPI003D933768
MGGLALLGVGAVAALIGVASLVGGGGGGSPTAAGPTPTAEVTAPATPAPTDPNAATTPAPAPAPATTPPPAATPAPGGVPVPSFGATPNAVAGPTKAAPAPAPRTVAKQPVRVYNNSTIQGLAARAAADLRAAGWQVTEIKGYPGGIIPTSTVYFRPESPAEEASARELGAQFGLRVEQRFAGIQDATPGLIVIVTKDYKAK